MRTVSRLMPALVSLIALFLIAVGVSGQVFVGTPAPPQFAAQGQPSTKNGEWPHYNGRPERHPVLAARSDQRRELQQAGSRLALQDRQLRPVSRVQAGRDAADGQGRALHDRRHAAIGHRARREDRRADLVAQPARREARGRRAAAAVGPRRVVLDRRQRGRARHLRHDGLSARRAQREDGRADQLVRHQRHRRSEGRRGQGEQAADRSGDRRDRRPFDADHRQGRGDRRLVVPGRRRPSRPTTTRRAWSAPSTCGRASSSGSSTPFRDPASSATTRGRTTPGPSNGNVGVWTQITVDEELGLVYLPVETPTSDFYGGHRPGNNLFAESLVCVDLKTGQRKWHFQFVHHPVWNFDMSAAPILADINVDGRAIKAVAQLTKQGWVYVFDRVTGQPVWPIEERPVPQSDVPGEKTSPTQPHPTKPPAYARNFFKVPDDLIDFTPELRAQALKNLKRYKYSASRRSRRRFSATSTACSAHVGWRLDRDELAGRRLRSGDAHRLCAGAANTRRRDRSSPRLRDSRISGTSRASPGGRSWKSSGLATAAPPMRGAGPATSFRKRRPRRGRPPAAAGAARRLPTRWRPERAGTADPQAAVRHARGDRSGSRRDPLAECRTATRRTTSAITRRSKV